MTREWRWQGGLHGRTVATALLLLAPMARPLAASDPGVRGGPPDAGAPLLGLTADEEAFFAAGQDEFTEVQSVRGEAFFPGTEAGLGPRFNLNSCAGCHAQPAVGGTSPTRNPQVEVATLAGARNAVPWFVALDGPVREARFVRKPDGARDGGVTNLFVITGRIDAAGCDLAQPSFLPAGDPRTGKGGNDNLIFRIPTPTFGAGMIEAIPDSVILANKAARRLQKIFLGISGRENRSGNDGSITRFGWKAQNKSLLLFSGEAYNVEQGVTNELFGDEREQHPACLFNALPEDGSAFASDPGRAHGGIVKFAVFMRLLAPPQLGAQTPSTARGRDAFDRAGCALCHTPALRTGTASIAALSERVVPLYSDLLLHDMGVGLADGIVQGAAGPREFRTAPLWGLGQRIFLLHDGRTTDLVEAIVEHESFGSEANLVVGRFRQLSEGEKQDLLNFLRSL